MNIYFIPFFLLIFLSFFCSGSETALFSLSSVTVEDLKRKYPKRGGIVALILDNPQQLLITILIVNIFANICLVIIAKKLLKFYFNTDNVFLNIAVMTPIILIFGEVTPKTLAIGFSTTISLFVAPVFYFLSIILYPFIIVLKRTVAFLVNINSFLFYHNSKEVDSYNPDEMIYIINSGLESGILDTTEADILKNVISFSSVDIYKLIRPRTEIFSLSIDEAMSDVIDKIRDRKFSRIPVWEKTEDNIIGILYVRELIKINTLEGTLRDFKYRLKKPLFIPDSMKAEKLLKIFQTTSNHLALVIDEFGGLYGLITFEDVLEAIVGDVADKDDIVPLYHFYNNYMIEIEARMEIDEFNRVFSVDLGSCDAATVGGYILEKIGRIPKNGELFKIAGLQFKISGAKSNKIQTMMVTKQRRIKKNKNIFLLPQRREQEKGKE